MTYEKNKISFFNSMSSMNSDQVEFVRNFIKEKAGIHISKDKSTFIECRVSKRLKALKINDYNDYFRYLKKNSGELPEFINSLTTNKTHFFREEKHFEYLMKVFLPHLKNTKKDKVIRVWSAASSTGEEIYTLAIVLSEFFLEDPLWDFKILGTDIDTQVLEKAKRGVYLYNNLEDVDPRIRMKYFEPAEARNSEGKFYSVRSEIKNLTKFRQYNLIKDDLPVEICFDVIFLRNVLIYFKPSTIELIVNKLSKRLQRGGLLFIGHSENITKLNHDLISLGGAIYQKP